MPKVYLLAHTPNPEHTVAAAAKLCYSTWAAMIDYITKLPFLTPMYIIAWIVFLWKDKMTFRDRCDWTFMKSVDFLLRFKAIGWNYIVSSVIICVVVPILI